MSLDNMVQNNRRNGARGGGRVRGMRCVRCPGGQGRGMRGVSCPGGQGRRLRGVICPGGQRRGMRGISFTAGKQRGLRGVSCPAGKQKGLQGVRGSGGQKRGLRDVRCPGRQGRDLRGVRGPIRGVVRSVVRQHRSPLGIHSIVKDSVLGDRLKAAGTSGVESGTKLQVSNLNAGVSNEDIRGSAEVVFARRGDAFQAVKRYNNAQLDGNPMKIENVRSVARAHVASRLNIVGGTNGRRSVHMTPETDYTRNRQGPGYMRNRAGPGTMRNMPTARYMRNAAINDHDVGTSRQRARGGWNAGPVHGRGGCGAGRRHSGIGGRMAEKSAQELNKELEIYQAQTTQTV